MNEEKAKEDPRVNRVTDKAAPISTLGDARDFGNRMSAKSALIDRAWRLRAEANRLEALANAMPGVLNDEADQALYDLVMKGIR